MTETAEEYRKRIAGTGGKANAKKHGHDFFVANGKKGAEKRWGKKKRVKFLGII